MLRGVNRRNCRTTKLAQQHLSGELRDTHNLTGSPRRRCKLPLRQTTLSSLRSSRLCCGLSIGRAVEGRDRPSSTQQESLATLTSWLNVLVESTSRRLVEIRACCGGSGVGAESLRPADLTEPQDQFGMSRGTSSESSQACQTPLSQAYALAYVQTQKFGGGGGEVCVDRKARVGTFLGPSTPVGQINRGTYANTAGCGEQSKCSHMSKILLL